MSVHTIYCVRHGQDEDNANGILNGQRNMPLTSLGEKQAEATAQRLVGKNISAIYTSRLKRAMKTACIIGSRIGYPDMTVLPELRERHFGVLTGKLVAEIPRFSKNILVTDKITYFLEAAGAETFPELYERTRKCLIFICRTHRQIHPGKNLLIVSHGDVLKMVRAIAKGLTWREGLRTPYIDNAEILEIPFGELG